jgi:methionine-rich copper-binding protein CopC
LSQSPWIVGTHHWLKTETSDPTERREETMSPFRLLAPAAAILLSGCGAASETDLAGPGRTDPGIAHGTSNAGDEAGPQGRSNDIQPVAASQGASLLESASPSDGARLAAPPRNLVLHFRVPVRLQEVTILGSDGQSMPMMINSAGLSRAFSVPMPDLEPGPYTVRWRVLDEAARSQEGSLGFVISAGR